jgi:hypothetical protein
LHPYDKEPPKCAKDHWAWDYTRDKMEASSGLPYPEWEGRHFAGAAAMYKNVVKKYGESRAQGRMTLPKECAECGQQAQHYEDDYVCVQCREALEGGVVPEGAVVSSVEAEADLEATRAALEKKLGLPPADLSTGGTSYEGEMDVSYQDLVEAFGAPHNNGDGYKVDAEWVLETPDGVATVYNYKTGQNYRPDGTPVEDITDWHIGGNNQRVVNHVRDAVKAVQGSTSTPYHEPTTSGNGQVSGRNYGAMGESKLKQCIDELSAQSGDAYDRCVAKGADSQSDLMQAHKAYDSKYS